MDQFGRYSRRKLLYSLGLGGVGVATGSWAGPALSQSSINPLASVLPNVLTPLRQAGVTDWSAAVGSTFTIRGESGSAAVKLVAVQNLQAPGARPAGLRPSALALVFEGTASALFPAGNRTYVFEQSDGANPLQLFVGRKSVNGATAQLIAVLN
jgi:hypothetical protein